MRREAGWRWPTVLTPAYGRLPPALQNAAGERVLHVALRTPTDKQEGLDRALRSSASSYSVVDWMSAEADGTLADQLYEEAARILPTLVFMQLQRSSPVTPKVVEALREKCDADAVIVNWDGDQHHEPQSAERRWFVELGHSVDTSLVVNTRHPEEYAAMGVRFPGYLQIGFDEAVYFRAEASQKTHPTVAFLANCYAHLDSYSRRRSLVELLQRRLGKLFAVYGGGWPAPGLPSVQPREEGPIYRAATAAISMSIRRDLPRYSSDRLLRALGSGALVLAEAFPDTEGLGLRSGDNCLLWHESEDLLWLVREILARPSAFASIRERGAELAAQSHTWMARMPELMAIVDAVRRARPAVYVSGVAASCQSGADAGSLLGRGAFLEDTVRRPGKVVAGKAISLRIGVGVLTHGALMHRRVELLENTVRSLRGAFWPVEPFVVDNGSTDGSERIVVERFGGRSVRAPDGNTTPGQGVTAVVEQLFACRPAPDLLVLSDDDMLWKPEAGDVLGRFWGADPGSVAILCAHLEPQWPWNTPRSVHDSGGVRALVRDSAPACAWTLRVDTWRQTVSPLARTWQFDTDACLRVRKAGKTVAQVDLAEHVGWERSTHGNRAIAASRPLDKKKWGLE